MVDRVRPLAWLGVESRTSSGPLRRLGWIALGLLILGAALARFGLIDLIAKGYGTLSWLFLLIFVIPILTRGIWLIRARQDATA